LTFGGLEQQLDSKLAGVLRERLWVLLLPGFLVLAIVGATLATWHTQSAANQEARDRLKRRMQATLHGLVPSISRAFEFGDHQRMETHLDILGRAFAGRALLLDADGALVHESGRRAFDGIIRAPTRVTSEADEIIVWEPLRSMAGARLGEVRIQTPTPKHPDFSWSVWSVLVAAFSLIMALVMFLVTRCLAPLGRLGDFFHDLAELGPLGVKLPSEGFAEFAQLREDIEYCLDTLRHSEMLAEENFVQVALDLAREFELHREGSSGHSQRTCRFAGWMAEAVKLTPEERDSLEVAALCHDIGRRPTEEGQWEQDADVDLKHPLIGASYFDAFPGLTLVAKNVRHHHENYDGSGFPTGLKGHEIPIGARILRIVDCYERLQSDWCGGDPLTPQEALDEMKDGIGVYFDPELFKIFCAEVIDRESSPAGRRVTIQAIKPV